MEVSSASATPSLPKHGLSESPQAATPPPEKTMPTGYLRPSPETVQVISLLPF